MSAERARDADSAPGSGCRRFDLYQASHTNVVVFVV